MWTVKPPRHINTDLHKHRHRGEVIFPSIIWSNYRTCCKGLITADGTFAFVWPLSLFCLWYSLLAAPLNPDSFVPEADRVGQLTSGGVNSSGHCILLAYHLHRLRSVFDHQLTGLTINQSVNNFLIIILNSEKGKSAHVYVSLVCNTCPSMSGKKRKVEDIRSYFTNQSVSHLRKIVRPQISKK